MVKDARGVTVRLVLTVVVAVTGLSWIVLRWWTDSGHVLPGPSWGSAVLLVFMAAGIYVAGLPVRRWQRGESTKPLSMVRALRTLVLAQAAALTGAMVTGWYAALVLLRLGDLDVAAVRADALGTLVLVGAGVLLTVAGLLAQRMCRVDEDRDEKRDEDRSGDLDERP